MCVCVCVCHSSPRTVRAASLPGEPITPPPEANTHTIQYEIHTQSSHLGGPHCHRGRGQGVVWSSWGTCGKVVRDRADPMT